MLLLLQDGWLTRRGFLARWRHLVARDTPAALAGLLYLGYKPEGELGVLFSVSKPRRAERKDNALSRSFVQVLLCLAGRPELAGACGRGRGGGGAQAPRLGAGLLCCSGWQAAHGCRGLVVGLVYHAAGCHEHCPQGSSNPTWARLLPVLPIIAAHGLGRCVGANHPWHSVLPLREGCKHGADMAAAALASWTRLTAGVQGRGCLRLGTTD